MWIRNIRKAYCKTSFVVDAENGQAKEKPETEFKQGD